jgi:5'-3' exonuclease
MLALIDGDIVVYRAAAVSDNDPDPSQMFDRIDWTMQNILDACNTKNYIACVGGGDNFRKKLDPTYKANRVKEPPKYLNQANEYLVTRWGSKVATGWETDDELGVHATLNEDNCYICSIDKDLRQIPGKHYNFVRNDFQNENYVTGMYNFFTQMLKGDYSDNVKGVPKIGEVRAKRILSVSDDPQDWEEIVSNLYKEHNLDYELNYYLLWIARSREYLEEVCEMATQRSMLTQEKENSHSLELTTQTIPL